MPDFENLCSWFDNAGKVMVALSGGVDSALVAFAAYRSLGDSAVAVTADYKTLSSDELQSAKSICRQIGIRHTLIQYDELQNPDFVANDKNRCYHCRSELSGRLTALALESRIDTIVDGTNTDDLGDYRPGISAMKKNGIRSPLVDCKFDKKNVRTEAKKLGMNVWDRPSNSCLASRIPWGTKVTAERLVRIELAETVVKNSTGVKQVRVRDMDGAARIEVGKEDVRMLLDLDAAKMLDEPLRLIGFTSVTVDGAGYVPGGANAVAD